MLERLQELQKIEQQAEKEAAASNQSEGGETALVSRLLETYEHEIKEQSFRSKMKVPLPPIAQIPIGAETPKPNPSTTLSSA